MLMHSSLTQTTTYLHTLPNNENKPIRLFMYDEAIYEQVMKEVSISALKEITSISSVSH
jgi:hypothetical protein